MTALLIRYLFLVFFLTMSLSVNADIIFLRDGNSYTGTVTRVQIDSISIALEFGEMALQKSNIERVEVHKPGGLDSAMSTLKSQNYSWAATSLKPIVDRYAGLPASWASDAMLGLGDAYLGMKNYAAAKQIFEAYEKHYPNSQQTHGLEVKFARVLFQQKQYNQAIVKLEAFLKPAIQMESVSDRMAVAIGEALVMLGDCQRATNQGAEALDNYLLAVTLFNVDKTTATEAKYKAAELFEEVGNIKRAKGSYHEIIKESGNSRFASAAKSRLDALTDSALE